MRFKLFKNVSDVQLVVLIEIYQNCIQRLIAIYGIVQVDWIVESSSLDVRLKAQTSYLSIKTNSVT